MKFHNYLQMRFQKAYYMKILLLKSSVWSHIIFIEISFEVIFWIRVFVKAKVSSSKSSKCHWKSNEKLLKTTKLMKIIDILLQIPSVYSST